MRTKKVLIYDYPQWVSDLYGSGVHLACTGAGTAQAGTAQAGTAQGGRRKAGREGNIPVTANSLHRPGRETSSGQA
jgi:hypothetical protein